MIKLSKYFNILSSINWCQTWQLYRRVKKPRSSSIRVLNRSNIKIATTATIAMSNNSSFEINRQDYIKTYERSIFYMGDNSKLSILGRFSMYGHSSIMVLEDAILEIGNNTYLNGGHIECTYRINIGNDCAIADDVRISDGMWHVVQSHSKGRGIRIGDKVWIATGAMILQGVTIGDGAIVAARAVVTKDVPARSMVAGIPARVVKENVEWKH